MTDELVEIACRAYNSIYCEQADDAKNQPAAMLAALAAVTPQIEARAREAERADVVAMIDRKIAALPVGESEYRDYAVGMLSEIAGAFRRGEHRSQP